MGTDLSSLLTEGKENATKQRLFKSSGWERKGQNTWKFRLELDLKQDSLWTEVAIKTPLSSRIQGSLNLGDLREETALCSGEHTVPVLHGGFEGSVRKFL